MFPRGRSRIDFLLQSNCCFLFILTSWLNKEPRCPGLSPQTLSLAKRLYSWKQVQELGTVLDLHERIFVKRKQERQAGTGDASMEVDRRDAVPGFVTDRGRV